MRRLSMALVAGSVSGAVVPWASIEAATPKAEAYRKEGLELLEKKEVLKAIVALEKAVNLDSTDAEIWADLGNAELAKGDFARAAQAFKRAVGLAPGFSVAEYNLAYALRRAGDLAGAAAAYTSYLSRHTEDADAYYGLGETLRALGRIAEAKVAYAQYVATEKRPDKKKWIDRAQHLVQELQAQTDKMRDVESKPAVPSGGPVAPVVASREKDVAAPLRSRPEWFSTGLAKLKVQDFRGALLALENAGATKSSDPWIVSALGSAYLGLERYEEAITAFRRALADASPEMSCAVRFALGEALRASGSPEAASEFRTLMADAGTPKAIRDLLVQRLSGDAPELRSQQR